MNINILQFAPLAFTIVIPALFPGCFIWIAGEPCEPDSSDSTSTHTWTTTIDGSGTSQQVSATRMFPYENTGNWWWYTAGNGNRLFISVEATITDGPDIYYKVSFAEEQIDTTQDWFRNTARGIEFSSSLQGSYALFLPSPIRTTTGTFQSGLSSVSYSYHDVLEVGGVSCAGVVECDYTVSILHGFDLIYFADSLGIVSLIDEGGRFEVQYVLDSCSIGGTLHYFQ